MSFLLSFVMAISITFNDVRATETHKVGYKGNLTTFNSREPKNEFVVFVVFIVVCFW